MITDKYVAFFRGLKKNNHKEWFHENKKVYENDVKKPFLDLLELLIPEIKMLEPGISSNPKDALFRINRDIRFSKDKTPYNTIMKAGFSRGGKRSELPGFYLGIDQDHIHMGGGLFNLKGPELKKVRSYIAQSTDEFVQIVNSKSFKERFGELSGERAKRVDKAYQPLLDKTPYIANKQFYAMQQIPLTNHINSDQIPGVIMESFREVSMLNNYLNEALS